MVNRTVCRALASLAPYYLLHTAEERELLQYYRQLSQTDQGFIRRASQALARYSAMEQGERA